ncbi:MAG TPA: hypothetical protein VF943_04305 [Burkholderiales bacterium]
MRANLTAVLSVLAGLCACSSVDRFNAPPLAGAPATSALVLVRVDASVRGFNDSRSLQVVTGGTLERIDDGRRFEGTAVAGYLVFSGLEPGPYRLTTVRTTWNNLTYVVPHLYTVPLDSARAYDLSLRTGEPCFLGVVAVEDVTTPSERGIYFELKDIANAEMKAWTWFIGIYPGSPWVDVARRGPSEACTRR